MSPCYSLHNKPLSDHTDSFSNSIRARPTSSHSSTNCDSLLDRCAWPTYHGPSGNPSSREDMQSLEIATEPRCSTSPSSGNPACAGTSKNMPEIVSLGECMIELFSEQPMEEAETFQRSLAGDSLNILVAAARLGTTTGYITRVGDDPFGGYLLNAWRNKGIDVSQVKVVAGFNAVHFIAQLPPWRRPRVRLLPQGQRSEHAGAVGP